MRRARALGYAQPEESRAGLELAVDGKCWAKASGHAALLLEVRTFHLELETPARTNGGWSTMSTRADAAGECAAIVDILLSTGKSIPLFPQLVRLVEN